MRAGAFVCRAFQSVFVAATFRKFLRCICVPLPASSILFTQRIFYSNALFAVRRNAMIDYCGIDLLAHHSSLATTRSSVRVSSGLTELHVC
jgi:hypothetical protein